MAEEDALKEAVKLDGDALIDLFEIDLTSFPAAAILRWHNQKVIGSLEIVFDGDTFIGQPIIAEGFEYKGNGTIPEPTLRTSNVTGNITALLLANSDFTGAKVTRIRTYAKHLATPAGSDPDGTSRFVDEVWEVRRKVNENKYEVTLGLGPVGQIDRRTLPARRCDPNYCSFVFKGLECAASTAATICGNEIHQPKSLAACSYHLDQGDFAITGLPTAAFPGLRRL